VPKKQRNQSREFCVIGGQRIFFGGPTPKPEVELVGDEEGVCRAWGGYQAVKTFSENSQGLLRYLMSPLSGKSRRLIYPKFGGSQGDPRADQ